MAKSLTHFVCQGCGASVAKWQGQCDNCGEWNTLIEEKKIHLDSRSNKLPSKNGKMNGLGSSISGDYTDFLQPYNKVKNTAVQHERVSTLFQELDRVLGGGLVPGVVILIGGEPGIGKSTLLTQVMVEMVLQKPKKVLYVSGEESPSQINLRINRYLNNEHISKKNTSEKVRINKKNSSGPKSGSEMISSLESIQFLTTTDVDLVCQALFDIKPDLVIVDSIQTITSQELTGAAGSIGQLRETADRLTQVVKAMHIPLFLVGHVTKEGTIAGPKVLEHIVDCVLEISGDRSDQLRMVRAIKNRFGATDEVGVFRHTEYGLEEVTNPSELFLEQGNRSVPGSATVCVIEGTRPLLAEVQALVVASQLAMPRRVGRGIELSRIQVLAAVLQKHCRLPLGSHDIFLNAAGGFTLREPSVDLGAAVAMASSLKNIQLPQKSIFIGEVGLLGEIRKVSYLDRRIKEAKRLGYTNIYSQSTHRTVQALFKDLHFFSQAF